MKFNIMDSTAVMVNIMETQRLGARTFLGGRL